jgi:hypothetical protein
MITSHQHSILLLTGFTMSQQYEDFIITAIIIQIFHLEKKKKKKERKKGNLK